MSVASRSLRLTRCLTSEHPRVLMLGMGWFPASVGGLDRYYRSLLEHLPEAGGVALGPAADAPERVRVVSRGERMLPLRVLAYWRAAARAGRRAQLVDAHFALYAAAPLLLGRLRGLPTVYHFQGPWAEEGLAAGERSRARYAVRRALERAVIRRADAHVVLSGAFRRLLVEHHRVAPWGVHVLPPGVDLDAFAPGDRARARERLGIEASAFVACCARRLVQRMGVDELLDAWARLERRLPPGSSLLLVGDGPLRESCARRASQRPLSGRVRVMGRIDDDELIDVYRTADLALVPSVAFEGFGLVVLEAAACGTPSVVSDVGGLPEVAAPLDPSLVVPAQDVEALAARIESAANGALPSRAATRAYAERFDWPRVAERHRRLYRRLRAGERDERLRVVYLDHVARLSGGEIALLRVLPHLRGVNAHVILGEDGLYAQRLAQAGVSVEVLPISPRAGELRKDAVRIGAAGLAGAPATIAHVVRLALRLRALKPDVVHTNSLKAGVYGSLAARAAGVPVVWHARDRIAEDYLPTAAVALVRSLMSRLPAAVVANSDATLATLGVARAGQPRVVIPDTVIAPMLSPARAGAGAGGENGSQEGGENGWRGGGGGPTFGMVGRIAPWKGQDLFLRAFALAFPRDGARAVVVGSALFGEHSYEQELPRLAASLGIADRVSFRGFREDVWGELAGFDALVHASTTPEPFGQVVLEGMAAGLPVIAPDVGGPASLISDGESGMLFEMGDERALAACMRAVCEDPATRARVASAAREAAKRYHPDVAAAALEDLYARIARTA